MKKNFLIFIIVIIIVAVGVAGYYFIIKKTVRPVVWDGFYKMTGNLTCEGNFPNLTTIPMSSTVTVSNNKIVEQVGETVKSFAIDKHGKATELIEPTKSGDVTAGGKADYQFYEEDGAYKFTSDGAVDMSTVKSGKTYSSTCKGTVSGIKQ
jgi:hypothetical protein